MVGNPKYVKGQLVSFECDGHNLEGIVYIIDRYGCFEDDTDVCYDIFVAEENCLYKHINEKSVMHIE